MGCSETLHLDPLEDFNATEADLMDLKEKFFPSGRPGIITRLHPSDPCLSHHPQDLARRNPPWVILFCPPAPQHLHPSARVFSLD